MVVTFPDMSGISHRFISLLSDTNANFSNRKIKLKKVKSKIISGDKNR